VRIGLGLIKFVKEHQHKLQWNWQAKSWFAKWPLLSFSWATRRHVLRPACYSKDRGISLSTLPKDTTSQFVGLVSTLSL